MVAVEKKGRPTVSITARHFINDAHTTADILGLPGLPLAIVERPITSQTEQQIREMIAIAVADAERGLTQRPVVEKQVVGKPSERETIQGDDLLDCARRMNGLFVEREWSDGLPLVPPTPRAVQEMLAHTRLAPDTVVAKALYPGLGIATVEKIAINGVMAGCQPEHMPVLIALVRAYQGLGVAGKTQAMSTGPNAPLVMVSGPAVKQLGFNYGTCVIGPGSPSHVNSVIGRALRLIMMNIGQAYPGRMDMDTLGSSNKYSFCVAEHAERSPWAPWNVEKGFDQDTSTVSIAMVYPGADIYDHTAETPQEMMDTLATLTGSYIGMASIGRWLYGGRGRDPITNKKHREVHVLLLAPTHADLMRRAGWTRADIANCLYERSRIPFRLLYKNCVRDQPAALKAGRPELMWLLDQPETKVAMAEGPECFETFVTGGDVGRSQFFYGASEVSTAAIEE